MYVYTGRTVYGHDRQVPSLLANKPGVSRNVGLAACTNFGAGWIDAPRSVGAPACTNFAAGWIAKQVPRVSPRVASQALPAPHNQVASVSDAPSLQGTSPDLPAALSKFESNPSQPLLGKGAFAKVIRVKERSTKKDFAVKILERSFFEIRAIGHLIQREINALRRCAERHCCRHVVRLLDDCEEAGRVYLRFELCQTSLLQYAQSQGGRVLESEVMPWAKQLLVGLQDLHNLGILHRDIKPDNLLLDFERTLKITDFGWCAELRDFPSDLAGTFQYMAPEMMAFKRTTQTEAIDVWSAGATLFELLIGHSLLTSTPIMSGKEPNFDPMQREIHQRFPFADSEKPSHLASRCWDLLRLMLFPDARTRILIQTAKCHPWLQEIESILHASKCDDLESPGGMQPECAKMPPTLARKKTDHMRAPSNASTVTPRSEHETINTPPTPSQDITYRFSPRTNMPLTPKTLVERSHQQIPEVMWQPKTSPRDGIANSCLTQQFPVTLPPRGGMGWNSRQPLQALSRVSSKQNLFLR